MKFIIATTSSLNMTSQYTHKQTSFHINIARISRFSPTEFVIFSLSRTQSQGKGILISHYYVPTYIDIHKAYNG